MGAQIRRNNEKILKEQIRNTLGDWSDDLDKCSNIFICVTKNNQNILVGEPPLLNKNDIRIKNVPINTYRPTLDEVMRIYNNLTTINIEKEVTIINDEKKKEEKEKEVENKEEEEEVVIEKEEKEIIENNDNDNKEEKEAEIIVKEENKVQIPQKQKQKKNKKKNKKKTTTNKPTRENDNNDNSSDDEMLDEAIVYSTYYYLYIEKCRRNKKTNKTITIYHFYC